jgi:hypothetical protein
MNKQNKLRLEIKGKEYFVGEDDFRAMRSKVLAREKDPLKKDISLILLQTTLDAFSHKSIENIVDLPDICKTQDAYIAFLPAYEEIEKYFSQGGNHD